MCIFFSFLPIVKKKKKVCITWHTCVSPCSSTVTPLFSQHSHSLVKAIGKPKKEKQHFQYLFHPSLHRYLWISPVVRVFPQFSAPEIDKLKPSFDMSLDQRLNSCVQLEQVRNGLVLLFDKSFLFTSCEIYSTLFPFSRERSRNCEVLLSDELTSG